MSATNEKPAGVTCHLLATVPMVSAEQILTPDITEKLTGYESLGGVIDFKLFRVRGTTPAKEVHLLTAQKTLEQLKQESDNYYNKLSTSLGTNRDNYFTLAYADLLLQDGKQISPMEFFGPYFNFKIQKPILLGKARKPLEYYHYDDSEFPENVISVKATNGEYVTQGYADAFLNPPYPFADNMTNLEIGRRFLDLNQFLFDDINKIMVYAWNTDCSNYFDFGKEWWGSFFWTIYNPSEDWFIGITASTTD